MPSKNQIVSPDADVTLEINPSDDLLEAVQLLASSAIMDDIEDRDLRTVLTKLARRFEELDGAMAAGVPLPAEWEKARKDRGR